MVEGQVIGPFTTTHHFCERWYERTNVTSEYFVKVIEEGLYEMFGKNVEDDHQYYAFWYPKGGQYYVFVVTDGRIKTILTEKLYKQNKGAADLTRVKKHLRAINKDLRIKCSKAYMYVNGVIANETEIKNVDDPIWAQLHSVPKMVEVVEKALESRKVTDIYLWDEAIPILPTYTFELIMNDKVLMRKEVVIPLNILKIAREDRKRGMHAPNAGQPRNRKERRKLEKMNKG